MNLASRFHAARLLLGAAAILSAAPMALAQSTETERPAHVNQTTKAGTQLLYHQGPVLTGAVPIYLIWYGTWTPTQQAIITNFISNLSGSAWLDILKAYHNGTGVGFGGELMVPAQANTAPPLRESLTDAQVQSIVMNDLLSSTLPVDANAICIVLTGIWGQSRGEPVYIQQGQPGSRVRKPNQDFGSNRRPTGQGRRSGRRLRLAP